jgi:hypothetical protein
MRQLLHELWLYTNLKSSRFRPPLRQKHVWAIRTRLQIERQVRKLALFNLAIDSKLRGCDLVAIRVDDVARPERLCNRTDVRASEKDWRPVRFELTEQARQTIDEYLATADKKSGEYLFNGLRHGESMSTRQYARLLALGIGKSGVDLLELISVGVFLGVLGRILQNGHVYTIPHARRVPDYDSRVHATEDAMSKRTSIVLVRGLWADGSQLRGSR